MKDPRCMVGLHDDAQVPADDPSRTYFVCSRCGRSKKVKLPPEAGGARPPGDGSAPGIGWNNNLGQ
jgi:hypothetical protein